MKFEWIIRGPEQRRAAPQIKDYAWEHEQQLLTQRALRERLRYKGYVVAGTLGSLMQRVGDFGRKYFPFIGRGGWDGIGGRRL